MLPKNLSFVDIETTGANPQTSRIIEIGILRVENNTLVTTYKSLINPQVYIDPFIESLTGIHQDVLDMAPTFAQIKDEVAGILQDSVFVAHNVRFDYGFLRNEFKRFGDSFSAKHFCTVKLARLLYPGNTRYNLDSIIERFGFQCKNRHRAFDDAKVLWDFYQKAQTEIASETFEKAVQYVLKRPSVPLGILQEELDSLPETPGVYTFFGENDIPLYIGKSINIRERVLSHFSSDHLSSTEMKISQQIKRIETVQTAGELGALFLESTLIKKQQPLFNRKLRHARKLIVLKKSMIDGYAHVQKEVLSDIDLETIEQVIGVFSSQKQVTNFLYELSKTYRLCPILLGIEKGKGPCFSYHLESCTGACIKKVSPLAYNLTFDTAFYKHKIKQWPFNGPLLIKEKGETQEYFIVDKWCLIGKMKKEESEMEKQPYTFDYDTYKILQSYIRSSKNFKKLHSYAQSASV